jgi:hypothetical protein
MKVFTLFELFLVVFTFYGIFKYEGIMRALIPILCLLTMFLFERLRGKVEEHEEAKKRLLRYQKDEHIKEEEMNWESYEDVIVSTRMKDEKSYPIR